MHATDDVGQPTPEKEDEQVFLRALQFSCSAVFPMVLKVAIELQLLEIILTAGPEKAMSPEEIAARLPTQNPQAPIWVDRILRLLSTNSIVGCTVESGADGRPSRKYTMTPISKFFTKNHDRSIVNMFLLHHDKVFMDLCKLTLMRWVTRHHVKDSVLDGSEPVMAAYGMSSESQGTDPRFNKVFNEAMQSHSTITISRLLRTYGGFDDVEVLVDVGGGVGTTLGMITARHPRIKGINFDLSHVISEAQPLPGVEHVSGDMFEAVPRGDAIFLKVRSLRITITSNSFKFILQTTSYSWIVV
ncbi:caffeic acid [Musa troglodytarum]|uniref:Caffeic acid n=1 Tax=Musa troglodytarum TaxID=320322 RepID=A0A9E7JMF5_9LILI|nr:caffeic acid [Musa troglodytarum]